MILGGGYNWHGFDRARTSTGLFLKLPVYNCVQVKFYLAEEYLRGVEYLLNMKAHM